MEREGVDMYRRDAIKTLGTAVFGSVGASALAAHLDKQRSWKTAIGLNGFASASRKYGKVYPIREVLAFASRHGFDGVELVNGWPSGAYPRVTQKKRVAALKRLYGDFDLQIFSIQTGAAGAFAPQPEARREWLSRFRERAELARELGAECIGIWPGGPLRGQSVGQALAHLRTSLHQAAVIADRLGLIAAVEIEPPFAFHTEDHLKQILQGPPGSPLRAIYDPSHFDLMSGSQGRPHEMLQRIGVRNIGYVHLTDTDGTLRDGGTSKHLACGRGHVDIAKSLDTLWQGGFRGWIMIDAWEVPDPYDASLRGKEAIERALARVR